MIFASYCRKSVYSDRSDSVANQFRMCQEYANSHFPGEVDEFLQYTDEGFSGANTNRPGLKSLMEDIEAGRIQALVVYQLDRLSRTVVDFSDIYATLDACGVMFVSIKENIDTDTPMGRAMIMIAMVFAQMERETIAERIRDNMMGLAKKGLRTGAKAPIGYRNVPIEINGKKHVTMEVVPEEADYIREVFQDFVANKASTHGLEVIYKKRGKKTINGKFFSASIIHHTVTNMTYCEASGDVYRYLESEGYQIDAGSPEELWDGSHGILVYQKKKELGTKSGRTKMKDRSEWLIAIGQHDPIVKGDLWIQAQKLLKRNVFDKKNYHDAPLLKNIVHCAKCGHRLSVGRYHTKDGVKAYYHCSYRAQFGMEDGCDAKQVRSQIVDDAVVDELKKIALDEKLIDEYVDTHLKSICDTSVLARLEKDRDKSKARIERLTEMLVDSENAPIIKHLRKQMIKEDKTLAELEVKIAEEKATLSKSKATQHDKAKLHASIKDFIENFDGFSATERNKIAQELIKNCTWDGQTVRFSI